MQPLQVTLFSDGRPGHEKQSLGIISALQAYVEVKVRKVEVPVRSIFNELASHLSFLLNSRIRTDFPETQEADLIIGTGSRTHLPMLSAGRKSVARTVTCMTPASHLRAKFDLCCVPIHDQVNPAENIFFTVGPPTMSQGSKAHDLTRSLVLIGGRDDSSHKWDEGRIVSDLVHLIERSESTSWLIASSPRTPASTEERVAQELAMLPQVSFVPFSGTGPGWVEEMYRTHGTAWITADSISMVYEALSAGCRVGVIPVTWRRENNKFQRSLDYLLDKKLIIMLSPYLQGKTDWLDQEPLKEADRCAREILRRWWPKSIP